MVQLNKSTARAAAPPGADPSSRDQVEQFFRDHYRLLMQVVRMHGATAQEADDAIGLTMIDLWQRWHAYDLDGVRPGQCERWRPYARSATRLYTTSAPCSTSLRYRQQSKRSVVISTALPVGADVRSANAARRSTSATASHTR